MNKKISNKDKKDWENFILNKDKLPNKDLNIISNNDEKKVAKTIDLHGFSLEKANKIIEEFIVQCFNKKVNKIIVITGKGLRSKNKDNPYQSNDLSILKYSVPNYIKNNVELMEKILKIDFDSVDSPSKGNFDIFLKKNK